MSYPVEVYLYDELPKLKVASMRGPGVWKVDGVDFEDTFVSTRSVSTYPTFPNGEKDGDPLADSLFVQVHENRALVAVADGCSWGRRPRQAARDAVSACVGYLTAKQDLIHDLHDAGHFLLRSFAEAHQKIIAGKEDVWEAGTTTLTGVLCLELEPMQEGDPKWGVLAASVGDCKAVIATRSGKEVIDVTSGNRNGVADGRDPGGRLGPYVGHGWPDLRNLRLYFCPCDADDVIVIMSDGVHDNLDPQVIGKTPADLELPDKSWEALSRDSMLKVKADYMKKLLCDIIFSHGDPIPGQITERLIAHCVEVTRKSREYMEEDMSKKQPMDYIEFPGKMDHTTCVTYVVGRKGPST